MESTFRLAPQLVFSNCAVVVGEIRGELMAPVLPGNKIKLIGLGRFQGGEDRVQPGVGDGPRWQAEVEIGVVGGINGQVFFADITIKISQRINDGGIGLQSHSFLQAVVEYRRDYFSF